MAVLPAAGGWTAEDDVLLKNSVEAGASLESLVKGAVSFSRKFNLQELQDRWYALLYDSEMSAEASARMAKYETELSTSNPAKANRLFNSKPKGFLLYKRKIDSVKNQYYAMRKRVCPEPCLSADFCYVIASCSCSPGGDCACGDLLKHSEGHLLVHKVDPSGAVVSGSGCVDGSCAARHVHSNGNGQYSFHMEHSNSDGGIVIDGRTNHERLHGYSDVNQPYGYDYLHRSPRTSERNIHSVDNRSDRSDQYDNGATGLKALVGIDQDDIKCDQFSRYSTGRLLEPGTFKSTRQKWRSQASWGKLLGVNSPDMLPDMHRIERETLTLSDDKKMETNKSDALAFQADLDGGLSDCGLGNAMVSEGGFIYSCLKGFSQNENPELRSSEHSALDTNNGDICDSHIKAFLKGSSRGLHPSSDAIKFGNHVDPIQKTHNMADVSGVDTISTSSDLLYPGHDVDCMLNTKDSEIPSNDHIVIPDQYSLEPTSTFDQDSQHDKCLVTRKMENVQPGPPLPVNLEPAILEQKENMVSLNEGFSTGTVPPGMHGAFGGNETNMCTSAFDCVDEGEETTCDYMQSLTLDKSVQVPDQMNCKCHADKPQVGSETATKSCVLSHALPDTEFDNQIATMSTFAQEEESDTENSVPDYFDLEALILDLDLIPWDQESDSIQPEVSRFEHPENRKDLIRLEKGACAYMNRSIMSKGAFAIIYGQHLKCYIRDPEVTLGRETEEVHVDIDLGKEGKANKISRRQAIIKMDDSGSFYIKNIGKCSIFVNSKEVPCNKRIHLTSDSLLEIRNMKFIFHINHDAVRQHIVRSRRGSSQGENTTFDWNQDP